MQDELRQEAEELLESVMADPTTSLPKIESFLSEVLRLYPIAPFISRQNYEPVTLGDIHLDQHVGKLQHLSEISDKYSNTSTVIGGLLLFSTVESY